MILSVVTQEQQPNLNCFNSKINWQEYVSRTPVEQENWYNGTSREVTVENSVFLPLQEARPKRTLGQKAWKLLQGILVSGSDAGLKGQIFEDIVSFNFWGNKVLKMSITMLFLNRRQQFKFAEECYEDSWENQS